MHWAGKLSKAILINSILLNVGVPASMLIMVTNSSLQILLGCYIFLGIICATSVYQYVFWNTGKAYYIGLIMLFSLTFITSHGVVMRFLTPVIIGLWLYSLVIHLFVIGAVMLFEHREFIVRGIPLKGERSSLTWRIFTGGTILISLSIGMIWNRFMQDINIFSYWDVVNNAPFMYWENMILIVGVWVFVFNLAVQIWKRLEN